MDVQVSGLTRRFGRLTALDDVSFEVRPGEILGLIGPNGSGKTTLFECMAALMPADAGEVRLDGRPLPASRRGTRIFYLPDGIAPWPSQTVRWTLEFAVGFFGGDPARRPEVIQRLDIGGLLGQPVGTLSKGQCKRVTLAIGLLTPQPLLLADEPFDGLDLRQTREVAAALIDHARAGRTLCLSIHQIADAARVCDRFVLLSGGRVRGEGTAADLASAASARGCAVDARDLEGVFLALT